MTSSPAYTWHKDTCSLCSAGIFSWNEKEIHTHTPEQPSHQISLAEELYWWACIGLTVWCSPLLRPNFTRSHLGRKGAAFYVFRVSPKARRVPAVIIFWADDATPSYNQLPPPFAETWVPFLLSAFPPPNPPRLLQNPLIAFVSVSSRSRGLRPWQYHVPPSSQQSAPKCSRRRKEKD